MAGDGCGAAAGSAPCRGKTATRCRNPVPPLRMAGTRAAETGASAGGFVQVARSVAGGGRRCAAGAVLRRRWPASAAEAAWPRRRHRTAVSTMAAPGRGPRCGRGGAGGKSGRGRGAHLAGLPDRQPSGGGGTGSGAVCDTERESATQGSGGLRAGWRQPADCAEAGSYPQKRNRRHRGDGGGGVTRHWSDQNV